MTAREEEQLYLDLKSVHPTWTPPFISGYVHGSRDEPGRKGPKPIYVREARTKKPYALGYLLGFAVNRGPDAQAEAWFGMIGDLIDHASN